MFNILSIVAGAVADGETTTVNTRESVGVVRCAARIAPEKDGHLYSLSLWAMSRGYKLTHISISKQTLRRLSSCEHLYSHLAHPRRLGRCVAGSTRTTSSPSCPRLSHAAPAHPSSLKHPHSRACMQLGRAHRHRAATRSECAAPVSSTHGPQSAMPARPFECAPGMRPPCHARRSGDLSRSLRYSGHHIVRVTVAADEPSDGAIGRSKCAAVPRPSPPPQHRSCWPRAVQTGQYNRHHNQEWSIGFEASSGVRSPSVRRFADDDRSAAHYPSDGTRW